MNSSMKVAPVADARAAVVPLGSNASKSGLADASGVKIFSEKLRCRLWRRASVARTNGLGTFPAVSGRLLILRE